MLKNVRSIYVACSGGPDSTALLHAFVSAKFPEKIRLGVIHFNHGLRGRAALADQNAVQKMAASLGLPFLAGRGDVKKLAKEKRYSIEEAAREARYGFFIEAAKGHKIDAIALGHTMDDHAETILMRLLSGTGLTGLAGSRAVFERNGIRFIRPLIEAERAGILGFLKKRKISFRLDRSNESERFLRNRIRLRLIPFLKKHYHPGISHVLARLPETFQADADFVDTEAARCYKRLSRSDKTGVSFPREKFEKLPPAIQFRLLKKAANACGTSEFAYAHWMEFRGLLGVRNRFEVFFPGNVVCRVSQTSIVIGRAIVKSVAKTSFFSKHLNAGETLQIPAAGTSISCTLLSRKPARIKKNREDYAVLDADKVAFPLVLRNRKPGDRFQPLGRSGPKKLKDFFIERKIPREIRSALPLVLSAGKIVWVSGVGISETVKVTSETRNCVKLVAEEII